MHFLCDRFRVIHWASFETDSRVLVMIERGKLLISCMESLGKLPRTTQNTLCISRADSITLCFHEGNLLNKLWEELFLHLRSEILIMLLCRNGEGLAAGWNISFDQFSSELSFSGLLAIWIWTSSKFKCQLDQFCWRFAKKAVKLYLKKPRLLILKFFLLQTKIFLLLVM